MAGGKLSPRQKMINLMYLIFIAMLAMNMSKEVLSAFGLLNEKLTESNARASSKNKDSYNYLKSKASEQAKQYGEAKQKMDKLKVQADDLYNYLSDLKNKMISSSGVEDKKDYEAMDKSNFLDVYFFKNGKISKEGKKFISKMNNFRETAINILNNSELANVIDNRFNTNDVKNREGKKINWLKYNYEGFPLIASLTKLTQIQSDIKSTESDALSNLLQKELSEAVSMTNYDAMVVFDKNAYYPGERLSGKIILGKNDPNLTAERVVINGKEWSKDKIKAGQVILDGLAGNVGDKKLKGSFFFRENDKLVKIPINGGYSVIPKPNEAVISADKMNVVYKGLSNPLTISIPGVPSNKIKASAPGLKKIKGNSYRIRPIGKNYVIIRVSGVLPNGSKISSNKKFRIKRIPPAMASVRGRYYTVPMPKASLAGVTVGAGLPDFLFDLKLNVTSFKIKVEGQLAVAVKGTRMNQRAKMAIRKARRGGQVTIFDVQATVSGTSSRVPKVAPVIIRITN